jgi:hypothetical protein
MMTEDKTYIKVFSVSVYKTADAELNVRLLKLLISRKYHAMESYSGAAL